MIVNNIINDIVDFMSRTFSDFTFTTTPESAAYFMERVHKRVWGIDE